MRYIEYPSLNEALIQKWAAGRAKHGVVWQGEPVEEAFEECLDLIHYLDKAVEQGYDLGHLRTRFVAAALELRVAWRSKRLRDLKLSCGCPPDVHCSVCMPDDKAYVDKVANKATAAASNSKEAENETKSRPTWCECVDCRRLRQEGPHVL